MRSLYFLINEDNSGFQYWRKLIKDRIIINSIYNYYDPSSIRFITYLACICIITMMLLVYAL